MVSDAWQARVKCYTALIWWISLRYFTIGFEYCFETPASEYYRNLFAQVSPQVVGIWLIMTGGIGIVSQIFSWRTELVHVKMVMMFAVGVSVHALFRMTVLGQAGLYFDPMFILFLCDFGAMSLILIGIPHKRNILPC